MAMMRAKGTAWRVPVAGALLLGAMIVGAGVGCESKPQTEITIQLPSDVPEGVKLDWDRIRGADSYRMVFKRMTGAAVCTVMVAASDHPTYTLRRDALPAGLLHGWQLDMEMTAMRKGEPMPVTGLRPLLVP
jgi:hypothetical protein